MGPATDAYSVWDLRWHAVSTSRGTWAGTLASLGRCREPRGLLMPDRQDPLLALQDVCLIGNTHLLLLDSDIGDPASLSRSRSIGLAIFPTAFLGSVCSMKISRGTL